MDSENSVTQYIAGLRRGDEIAAQRIWERFLKQLIVLANRKLKHSPRVAMNEEDVVQNAFAQFFSQVQQGRFPKLNDRDDLWQVLAMLVDRRAKDQIKKQATQKAGAGRVFTESIFFAQDGSVGALGIDALPERIPTPELAVEMTELFRQRLEILSNDEYCQVALLKMQGFTNSEIATQLNSSLRTVERWLTKIREVWSNESTDE